MKTKKRTKKRTRGGGIACPSCKSLASDVSRTIKRDGDIQRERECLSCGRTYLTREKVLSTATDSEILMKRFAPVFEKLATMPAVLDT